MTNKTHDTANSEAMTTFLAWLRDAHAMEQQAEVVIQAQLNRLENYPAMKMRLEQHLRETEGHIAELDRLLEGFGDDGSLVKDLMSKVRGAAQSMMTVFAGDEVMKNALGDYIFEAMEIASYKILIAAAEELGLDDAAQTFKRILAEELAMAAWLDENLPAVTRSFIARMQSDLQAKR